MFSSASIPFPKTPSQTAKWLAFTGILPLLSAYIAEYGFNLHPCPLCLTQRIPYWVIIALGGVAWLARNHKPLRLLCVALAVGALLTGMGIAGYHAGVEYGWFPGPQSCSGATDPNISLDDLRAQIRGAAVVSCSEPAFTFLGISMAGMNAVLSLLLSLYWGLLLKRQWRTKR